MKQVKGEHIRWTKVTTQFFALIIWCDFICPFVREVAPLSVSCVIRGYWSLSMMDTCLVGALLSTVVSKDSRVRPRRRSGWAAPTQNSKGNGADNNRLGKHLQHPAVHVRRSQLPQESIHPHLVHSFNIRVTVLSPLPGFCNPPPLSPLPSWSVVAVKASFSSRSQNLSLCSYWNSPSADFVCTNVQSCLSVSCVYPLLPLLYTQQQLSCQGTSAGDMTELYLEVIGV